MGMPRLRHVLCSLVLAALGALACAEAKAPAAADPSTATKGAEQERGYGQDGYAQPPPGAMATSGTGQYPGAPGGLMWPSFDDAPASDLGGLQSQLDRAEQALGLALTLRVSSAGDAVHTSKTPPQPTPTGTAPAAPVTQADPCLIACAALASMKRSADHMCGLAGEKDAACGGARERVQRAEQRVTQACPACATK
jgi:hypothetical protein